MIGVAKAYVTRVGEGPFPTEIEGPDQERVRELGGEFGTVTGRERRCGWLDLVALRYAVRLNGITAARADEARRALRLRRDPGLHALPAARRRGDRRVPGAPERLPPRRPVYETLPGWREPLDAVESVDVAAGGRARLRRRSSSASSRSRSVLSAPAPTASASSCAAGSRRSPAADFARRAAAGADRRARCGRCGQTGTSSAQLRDRHVTNSRLVCRLARTRHGLATDTARIRP